MDIWPGRDEDGLFACTGVGHGRGSSRNAACTCDFVVFTFSFMREMMSNANICVTKT
jgi:hypothetical protein